jgi:hypothetical protein
MFIPYFMKIIQIDQNFKGGLYRVSFSSRPWGQQLAQHVLVYAGFLCDKSAMLRDIHTHAHARVHTHTHTHRHTEYGDPITLLLWERKVNLKRTSSQSWVTFIFICMQQKFELPVWSFRTFNNPSSPPQARYPCSRFHARQLSLVLLGIAIWEEAIITVLRHSSYTHGYIWWSHF